MQGMSDYERAKAEILRLARLGKQVELCKIAKRIGVTRSVVARVAWDLMKGDGESA